MRIARGYEPVAGSSHAGPEYVPSSVRRTSGRVYWRRARVRGERVGGARRATCSTRWRARADRRCSTSTPTPTTTAPCSRSPVRARPTRLPRPGRSPVAPSNASTCGAHDGVHPRLGVLDVVPFVALDEPTAPAAVEAARVVRGGGRDRACGVPVFLYDDADPTAVARSRRAPRRVRRPRAPTSGRRGRIPRSARPRSARGRRSSRSTAGSTRDDLALARADRARRCASATAGCRACARSGFRLGVRGGRRRCR